MGAVRYITDRLANLMTGAGTSVDRRTHAAWTHCPLNAQQIEASYRGSWLMRKAIDLPPYDMTRAGRDWQADDNQIELLEAEERRLGLWNLLQRALVLGRLGGGAIVLGVAQGDPADELIIDRIGKGQLAYATLFTRHQLSIGDIEMDPASSWFMQPRWFELRDQQRGAVRIHPSRVIAFRGQMVPDLGTTSKEDAFWGDPIAQAINDAVKNAEAAQNGFAALIDEAKLDIIKMPDLMMNAASAEYETRFLKRFELANLGKSTHRALVLDGNEDWQQRQITWSGMPDIIATYLAIVAAASDIPATRLLGKSPDGMNATGKGDAANYDTMITGRQENDLRPLIERFDEVMIRSALGIRPPEVWWKFAPLAVPSEAEEAATFNTTMDAIGKLQGSALIPTLALEKGVQNLMTERGWVPGLDGALAEMDEAERFPSEGDDGSDPSELVPIGEGEQSLPFGDGYHPKQRRDNRGRWAKSAGSVSATGAFVRSVKGRGDDDRVFDVGAVAADVAALIYRNTGLDVSSFRRVMPARAVRHTLKAHGAASKRRDAGERPTRARDIASSAYAADRVQTVILRGKKDSGGGHRIEYRLQVGQRQARYTERVGYKAKTLTFVGFQWLK